MHIDTDDHRCFILLYSKLNLVCIHIYEFVCVCVCRISECCATNCNSIHADIAVCEHIEQTTPKCLIAISRICACTITVAERRRGSSAPFRIRIDTFSLIEFYFCRASFVLYTYYCSICFVARLCRGYFNLKKYFFRSRMA